MIIDVNTDIDIDKISYMLYIQRIIVYICTVFIYVDTQGTLCIGIQEII